MKRSFTCISVVIPALAMLLGGPIAAQDKQKADPSSAAARANPVADQQRTLTNVDVLSMVNAGLSERTIILAIQRAMTSFDTSPEALITLKNHGVSASVLDAMLSEKTIPGSPAAPTATPKTAAPRQSRAHGVEGFPSAEIFTGFSYLSFDPQGVATRINMYGWDASVTGNPIKWFGIEGDFGGHYRANCGGAIGLTCGHTSFMGGPKLAFRSTWVTVYAHGLFGIDDGSLSFSGVSVSDKPFAFAAGGGVDVRVARHLSLRPAQFDYFMTRHAIAAAGALGLTLQPQNNYRFSTGLVFTFGG
jgi:hypothetical protein